MVDSEVRHLTIHLVGLPHTELDAQRYSSCAFTAKADRMVSMWQAEGLEVVTYWGGSGDVPVLSRAEQIEQFGEWDAATLPVVEWDATLPYWRTFHDRCRTEIDARIQPGDIVAFVGGGISRELAAYYQPNYTTVEPGIGYGGAMPDLAFGCYESHAWMHNRYGALGVADGHWFDTVIPNAIFPEDWGLAADGGYLLFVGRLIARKAPHVAAQVAREAGLPVIMAGAGVARIEPGKITATDGTVIEGDHVTHVGAVSGESRRALFAGARALLAPTTYIGPWEGVAAEALASGVPAITTDWGAFAEYVPERFRFRTMAQALDAVECAPEHRGQGLRDHILAIAGRDRCQRLYREWFDRLATLRDGSGGWYARGR